MNELKITLALTVQQTEIILAGLSELPLKVSGDLFKALKEEAEKQVKAHNEPKPEAAPATPTAEEEVK